MTTFAVYFEWNVLAKIPQKDTQAVISARKLIAYASLDRLKAKGKHQKVTEVTCMRKLLAIVHGCWSKGQWFNPNFEKRLKARQRDISQEETRPMGGFVALYRI